MTIANEHDRVIGGVCHGPLGLLKAEAPDGSPLVEGRRVTAVTDKQVKELGIESTRRSTRRRSSASRGPCSRARPASGTPSPTTWVVDGNLVTGQNQNAAPMVAREMLRLAAEAAPADA